MSFTTFQMRFWRWTVLIPVTAGLLIGCSASSTSTNEPLAATAVPTTPATVLAAPATSEPVTVTAPTAATPPAGLIFRSEGGLWQISGDGQALLLSENGDAYPSPDLSHAAAWDFDNTVTVTDLVSGSETAFTPDGKLSGFFAWADPQTLLLGLWLVPDEDGPNVGRLTTLNIETGAFMVLDLQGLLSSYPAMSPDGRTIAYDNGGVAYLYQADTGRQPLSVGDYANSSGFEPQMMHSPSWSTDGKRLSWMASGAKPGASDGAWQTAVMVIDLNQKTANVVHSFDPSPMGAFPAAAAWSQDGKWLAVRIDGADAEQSGLWLIASDGSQHLKLDGSNMADAVWVDDGRSLVHAVFMEDGSGHLGLFDTTAMLEHELALPAGLPVPVKGNLELAAVLTAPVSRALCPDIPRPALLDTINSVAFVVKSLDGESSCQFDLPVTPFLSAGAQSVNGNLYFAVENSDHSGFTIWRLNQDGSSEPLPYTNVPGAPYFFTVSADEQLIAWSYTDASENQYRNSLWTANLQTGETTSLLTDVVDEGAGDLRMLQPVRISADGSTLFYAYQPNGMGGMWFSFNGRYDSLYRIPTSGGTPVQLMANCSLCIGDVSPDGASFAFVDTKAQTIKVMDRDGGLITEMTPPAAEYIGFPIFSPEGQLAFVSATLVEEDLNQGSIADPGLITVAANPGETSEPGNILSQKGVSTLWQWMDETHILYYYYDEDSSGTYVSGVGIVGMDGSTQRLPNMYPLAVLR